MQIFFREVENLKNKRYVILDVNNLYHLMKGDTDVIGWIKDK